MDDEFVPSVVINFYESNFTLNH